LHMCPIRHFRHALKDQGLSSYRVVIALLYLHEYLPPCGMLHKWTKKTTCSTEACFVAGNQFGQIQVNEPSNVADVSDEFLTGLVSELDNDNVSAIILKGSCARGDETSYSDVDLT